ncbi:hypothetical protein V8G54_011918, partial [Vigna mungo]
PSSPNLQVRELVTISSICEIHYNNHRKNSSSSREVIVPPWKLRDSTIGSFFFTESSFATSKQKSPNQKSSPKLRDFSKQSARLIRESIITKNPSCMRCCKGQTLFPLDCEDTIALRRQEGNVTTDPTPNRHQAAKPNETL